MSNAVRKIIDAASGPVKLAKLLDCTYTAINTFERQEYLPLARAKQVMELFPGVVELRDLVRPDLRQAMDMQTGDGLLK